MTAESNGTVRAVKYRRLSEYRELQREGIVQSDKAVDRQNDDLDALARERAYLVVGDYCDDSIGASTRSTKPRPNYDRMIRDAKAGRFDVITAYTSSRLTRRPRELEDLIELVERYGIRIEYLKSPSFDLNSTDGRMIARQLASFDAAESERISERVGRAYVSRISNGGNHGGGRRPFGFESDGVTVIPRECAVIKTAAKRILAGGKLNQIAQDLRNGTLVTDTDGNPIFVGTVTGSPWRPDTLRSVLLRARNCGLTEHKGEIIEEAKLRPEIISREQWDAVRRILEDPSRRTNHPSVRNPNYVPQGGAKDGAGRPATWLLSGLVACDTCGKPLYAKTSGKHKDRPVYQCKVGHLGVAVSDLEPYVVAHVLGRLSRDDAVNLLPKDSGVDVAGLRTERASKVSKLEEIEDDFDEDRITRVSYLRRTEKLNRRIADIDAELASATRVSAAAELITADGAEAVAEVWDRMSRGHQRDVLRELVTITLLPVGKGARRFNGDRVQILWTQSV